MKDGKKAAIALGAVALGAAGIYFATRAEAAPPPSGEILDITWWDGASWLPVTEPMPANTYVTHRFRVKNTGNTVGAFKVGYSWYSELMDKWQWAYSPTFNIEAGAEGNVDWDILSAPGTYTTTFHLFSKGNDVDSVEVTITVV